MIFPIFLGLSLTLAIYSEYHQQNSLAFCEATGLSAYRVVILLQSSVGAVLEIDHPQLHSRRSPPIPSPFTAK